MKNIRILIIMTFMIIGQLTLADNPATNIELTDEKEIEHAETISNTLDNLSEQVMDCVNEKDGSTEGCTCETRSKCPFKDEFDRFINAYCDAIKIYPEWKEHNISYLIWEKTNGHTLGTKNINIHFGKECL